VVGPAEGAVVFGGEALDEAFGEGEFGAVPAGDGEVVAGGGFFGGPLAVVAGPGDGFAGGIGLFVVFFEIEVFAAEEGDFVNSGASFDGFGFGDSQGKSVPAVGGWGLVGAAIDPADGEAEAVAEIDLAEVVGGEEGAVAVGVLSFRLISNS
ncbi:MAG: hypothetical protein ACK5LK_12150, partial [Chthoniobacterales bacterium]